MVVQRMSQNPDPVHRNNNCTLAYDFAKAPAANSPVTIKAIADPVGSVTPGQQVYTNNGGADSKVWAVGANCNGCTFEDQSQQSADYAMALDID